MSRGKRTEVYCKHCNTKFSARLISIRAGKGKYCNLQCFHKSRRTNLGKKELAKIHQAKFRYGLEKEQYLNLVRKTNCEICNSYLDEGEKYIDHCHSSGRVRGVLCNKCNTGLGMFKDSRELLSKAITYLDK